MINDIIDLTKIMHGGAKWKSVFIVRSVGMYLILRSGGIRKESRYQIAQNADMHLRRSTMKRTEEIIECPQCVGRKSLNKIIMVDGEFVLDSKVCPTCEGNGKVKKIIIIEPCKGD